MPSNSTQAPTLFDAPHPGSNMPEFSVSELSSLLKKTVEDTFGLVRVRGEISGLKIASSGHVYFDLKDETAILASVCWKGQAGKLGLILANGMEVVCTGRLTTYAMRSNYQLIIDKVALAGIGALLKMLEDRKKRLAAEGLFDADRKHVLPYLPDIIGVITSPTGAVIRDILHRIADRFPRHVLVWPVAVQGQDAAEQIAAAIEGFNKFPVRPDVLIIARGGGSVEDLMPFNEESVVRAVAASSIPVISAVGHETDTTLIDYVADIRAPTPTAAAEIAIPVRDNLLAQVMDDSQRLEQAMRRGLAERREHLSLLARSLGDPARALEPLLQKLDDKTERLSLAWLGFHQRRSSHVRELGAKIRHPRDMVQLATQRLEHTAHRADVAWREYSTRQTNRLDKLAASLAHLSPRAVLGRGYALVQNTAGQVIVSRNQVKSGDHLRIEFNDGNKNVVAED